MNEFNLSECLFNDGTEEVFCKSDVEEFIRLLKEEVALKMIKIRPKNIYGEDVFNIIDKLAGDKLI